MPGEGTQLRQFSQRYQQGVGPDRVHFPVYCGLGNHDLDQDGPPPHVDWYRRELRDYVELNHRSSVFFKAPVPVTSYDVATDNYSWDWGGLHLVQTHKFAGDTSKGAIDSLPWLKDDLAAYAADGRPVILFQHFGWDPFSIERWDPARRTFDDTGSGAPHWWSEAQRDALLAAIEPYNVVAIFHGHEHESALVYRWKTIDLFKPRAAYMGGLAVARVTDGLPGRGPGRGRRRHRRAGLHPRLQQAGFDAAGRSRTRSAGYLVTGSSIAATCSLIAGRSPRRRASALMSVSPSRLQRPSAKISSGWKRAL